MKKGDLKIEVKDDGEETSVYESFGVSAERFQELLNKASAIAKEQADGLDGGFDLRHMMAGVSAEAKTPAELFVLGAHMGAVMQISKQTLEYMADELANIGGLGVDPRIPPRND